MTVATAPIATVPRTIATLEEFLALPEDGMDRWIIRGELREKPMTRRNRFHSNIMTCVATELKNWLRGQPQPRGQVHTGDAGVRLPLEPLVVVGIDVVYISPEVMAQQTRNSTIINGVPTLAVEILLPSDTQEEIQEKIDCYLEAGVPLVWIIDPRRQTVLVLRPSEEPVLFNVRQDISAEPHLPGFCIPVGRFFE